MSVRPIKFRAWDKLNNKMVPDKELQMQSLPDFKAVPLNQSLAMLSSLYALTQFTGLYDKNGREIYEGDIVDTPVHGGVCQVFYGRDYEGAFTVVHPSDHQGATLLGVIVESDIEVIGNIYERPELL